MRSILALLLSVAACATTEPCNDVSAHTRLTELGWSTAPVRALTVLLHNPREEVLSGTLDCTACDSGVRTHVRLAPHEHMPVLLARATDGCSCSLEHDEVLP